MSKLRALNHPATSDDVQSLLMPAVREGASIKRMQITFNSWSSTSSPVSFGMIRTLSLEETRQIMSQNPDLLQELKNCSKLSPTDENSLSQILKRNNTLLERIYSQELFVQYVETKPEDLPNNVPNLVAGVFDDLRNNSGFTGIGNTLSKDCRDVLVARLRAKGEAITVKQFKAMLKDVLLEEQRVTVLADKLKERWDFSHPNNVRPDSFWKSMAKGVMARMAKADNAAQEKLTQLNTATNFETIQKATFSNAVLRPFYNEAMQLAEKAEQAAQKAQYSVYARIRERTEILTGPTYRALDLSATFAAIQAEIFEGKIPAKDMDTLFQQAADTFVEKRLQLYNDASTAHSNPSVNEKTFEAWKLRALTEKTLPNTSYTDIVNICESLNVDDLETGLQLKAADVFCASLINLMQKIKDACDQRGCWTGNEETDGALQKAALEFLVSKHSLEETLGNAFGDDAFRQALEDILQNQDRDPVSTALGLQGKAQLETIANAHANAELVGNLAFHQDRVPEYTAMETKALEEVRKTFGSAPKTIKSIEKVIRQEEIHQKIENYPGRVTPEVYYGILQEAILKHERQNIIINALTERWEKQKLPMDGKNERYWISMARGVMASLEKNDPALLARLNDTRTAADAQKAVKDMAAVLDRLIAVGEQSEKAVRAMQTRVYEEMTRASGMPLKMIKEEKSLKIDFKDLEAEFLRLDSSPKELESRYMAKAQKFLKRRLDFFADLKDLELSPAATRHWKEEALKGHMPKVSLATIKTLCDGLDLRPLRSALATYRRAVAEGYKPQDRLLMELQVYAALESFTNAAFQEAAKDPLWPKVFGAEDIQPFANFINDYLMDRDPEIRFGLSQPGLADALTSLNFTKEEQGNNARDINFISGVIQSCNDQLQTRDAELKDLTSNVTDLLRKVLSERLHIPMGNLEMPKHAGLEARANELAEDIRTGRLPLPGEEGNFSNEAAFRILAEEIAQSYVDAYIQVDNLEGLSELAAAQMKNFLLTQSLPLPGGLSVADIVSIGKQQEGAVLYYTLASIGSSPETIFSTWTGLMNSIRQGFENRIGMNQFAALTQAEKETLSSLAWMAVQNSSQDLRSKFGGSRERVLEYIERRINENRDMAPNDKENLLVMQAILKNAVGNAQSDNNKLADSLGAQANVRDLSPMNAQMLQQSIQYLREHYGKQCVPDDPRTSLELRLPTHENKKLREVLQERIREADHSVTPQELANMTAELLLPLVQEQAAAGQLQKLAAESGIGSLHPETLAFALNTLRTVYPDTMSALAIQENVEGIRSLLAAIPQEELLAILREAHVIQGYAGSAMALGLSEAAGVVPSYALTLLKKNGRDMEAVFGAGYRAMLQQGPRLSGDDLANWCKQQADKATAPWANAIKAIKVSSLPTESQKVLLRRTLLEDNPNLITDALDVAQKLDVHGLEEALALNTNLDDVALIGLLENLADRLNKAVTAAKNRDPKVDEIRLRAEARDMLLALHPDLAEKLVVGAERLEKLFNTVVTTMQGNGLDGLNLIHAARGRQANLWLMPDEDVKAIRNGTATQVQQQKLDALQNRGRELLEQERQRLNLPPEKLPYLRNVIGAALQDFQIEDDDKERIIAERMDLLQYWEDVAPLDSRSNELAGGMFSSLQTNAQLYAADESRFGEENINAEMLTDLGRALFIFDGGVVPSNSTDVRAWQGIQAMVEAVPDPRARRFLSCFMYQTASAHIALLFSAVDAYGEQYHRMQGAEHMVKGVTGQLPVLNPNDSPAELSYELRMAPDKKSALVLINSEYDMKLEGNTSHGRTRFTLEIQVNLEGDPAITDFKIAQQIMPYVA